GHRRADPGALDLPLHAERTSLPEGRLAARDRIGNSPVVDRAFLLQACDGIVNLVGVVAAPGEPLPHLCFGQLSPGEHPQPIEVGSRRAHTETVDQPGKRVLSGVLPPLVTLWAIWSRLMSEVVEMP